MLVLPDTVVRWHRAGFRLYWAMLCKARRRVRGGRRISNEIRNLIFQMVAENPGWGAPRIHGELLMLGFNVSEITISRWMRRAPRKPEPGPRWMAFLRNHREATCGYAKTDELIELAKVVFRYGGIYATHVRGEGDGVLDSIGEAIEIGEKAKTPVEIFHLKVAGKSNRGRMPEVVALINSARARGIDVNANQYPYVAAYHPALTSCRLGRWMAASTGPWSA